MKQFLRKIFAPILNPFETGNTPYLYKQSHRVILLVIGLLFSGLATAVLIVAPKADYGFLIPVTVFYSAGLVAAIVGFLGNERAVAKIWGSKR